MVTLRTGSFRKLRELRVRSHTQARWQEYFGERLSKSDYLDLSERAAAKGRKGRHLAGASRSRVKWIVRLRFKGRLVCAVVDKRYHLVNTVLPPDGFKADHVSTLQSADYHQGDF